MTSDTKYEWDESRQEQLRYPCCKRETCHAVSEKRNAKRENSAIKKRNTDIEIKGMQRLIKCLHV